MWKNWFTNFWNRKICEYNFFCNKFSYRKRNNTNRFKNKLLSIIKEECFSLVINYGNRFIANKLLKNIISQLTEKIKENLMDNVMNIIELNGENIDKYIQYDKW